MMDPQMARHLFNDLVLPTIGVGTAGDSGNGIDYEVFSRLTPLWGALIASGVAPNVSTSLHESPKSIEDRKAVADFLRDWADAIEGPEVVKARNEKELEEFSSDLKM